VSIFVGERGRLDEWGGSGGRGEGKGGGGGNVTAYLSQMSSLGP